LSNKRSEQENGSIPWQSKESNSKHHRSSRIVTCRKNPMIAIS
jgi:hypothetical protein